MHVILKSHIQNIHMLIYLYPIRLPPFNYNTSYIIGNISMSLQACLMEKAEECVHASNSSLVTKGHMDQNELSTVKNYQAATDHPHSNFPPEITDSSIWREKLGRNGPDCLAAEAQQGLAVSVKLTSSQMKHISTVW